MKRYMDWGEEGGHTATWRRKLATVKKSGWEKAGPRAGFGWQEKN